MKQPRPQTRASSDVYGRHGGGVLHSRNFAGELLVVQQIMRPLTPVISLGEPCVKARIVAVSTCIHEFVGEDLAFHDAYLFKHSKHSKLPMQPMQLPHEVHLIFSPSRDKCRKIVPARSGILVDLLKAITWYCSIMKQIGRHPFVFHVECVAQTPNCVVGGLEATRSLILV